MRKTHDAQHETITATSAGFAAVKALSAMPQATILGITSRGIFLSLTPRQVVFLTTEQHRSPLTITLPDSTTVLEAIANEDAVLVQLESISFPDACVQIDIPTDTVWKCPAPSGQILPAVDRRRQLRRLASTIELIAPDRGWSAFLLALLDSTRVGDIPASLVSEWHLIRQVRAGLRAGDMDTLNQRVNQCLGRGQGLTPSGDDFMLGLTLMLNRWSSAMINDRTLIDAYNHHVVSAAYSHTTALSANLIECASIGTSDERLTRIADYLVTGARSLASTVVDVLHWGSSSGIDALVGMAAIMTANGEHPGLSAQIPAQHLGELHDDQ